MRLDTIILAAGKGSRMASNLPKVMHPLAGIPLLQHVFNSASALRVPDNNIHVVYGNSGGVVRKTFAHFNANWVDQQQQQGTGHAVRQALPYCDPDGRVLVLYGDVPLIRTETLQTLLSDAPQQGVGILIADLADPAGLGRIVRDASGNIIKIVEERDADAQQQQITEINTGIITCPARLLQQWLPKLTPHNHQKEYYLTDIVAMAVAENVAVNGVHVACSSETRGVNDLWQLAQLERYYQQQRARELALSGVKIIDPQRIDLRGSSIQIASGVTLDINVILEGHVTIAENTSIGANCIIRNCQVGKSVNILPNTIIEGATIASHSQVGPFAHIRSGTTLAENTRVGNFVEIKKTCLGAHSKASHLAYLGDSDIGEHVNIGAGTITCNYDGVNKSKTIIKDHAFIGSNTALIAPVTIGKTATIGAGSTISQNAPDNQLTLTREKQRSISGWKRPQKKKASE